MNRWIANLNLFAKIALPIGLLLIAVTFVIFTSYSALGHLSAAVDDMVHGSARRLELFLTVDSEINGAAIAEESVILKADGASAENDVAEYRRHLAQAVGSVDELIASAPSPERKAVRQELKNKILAYDKIAQDSLRMVADKATDQAYKNANELGASARRALKEDIDRLIGTSRSEMEQDRARIGAESDAADRTVLESAAIGALISLTLLYWIITRFIVRPFAGITGAMERLAKGDLDVAIDGEDREDEVGSLARSLAIFKQGANENRLLAEREKAEAAAKEQRRTRIDEATRKFDATILALIAKIKTAIRDLRASADTLSNNARQTEQQSAAVAAATEQATSNVETVSSASTELAASIQEISRQVQQTVTVTQSATDDANHANARISGLAEAAKKISEVIGLINSIAAQTNLLALNATIESARAGEAGKGFAVVANEVKHLAGQTGHATNEIAQQISGVQQETNAAVAAIGGITEVIAHINDLSTAIAGAVEEQGAATSEIARNVEEASRGTHDVALNIAKVAGVAGETGKMAQDVSNAADALFAESTALEREVETFLQSVRA